MSLSSQEMLKATVHQVLSHGQQVNTIWDEISSLGTSGGTELCSSITGLGCIPALKQAAEGSQYSEAVFSMRECAQRLRSLASQFESQGVPVVEQGDWQSTVVLVKHIMVSGMFRQQSFCQHLLKDGPIPVQLLWALCKERLLSLENFLQVQGGGSGFTSSFVDQLRHVPPGEIGVRCLADILTDLIYLIDQDKKTTKGGVDARKMSREVIDQLFLGVIDSILAGSVTEEDSSIVEALCEVDVELEVLNKTATHLLPLIISHSPVMKVSTAVRNQHLWSFGKLHACLIQLYKQLLLQLDMTGVLNLLHGILEHGELNWQLLLSLMSVTVVCMPESSRQQLEFLDKLLQESLEGCDRDSTITGLLLARQACLQGPHVFMPYADWFQRTFVDASKSLANNRKSFTFLLKLLTELVPYESAQHVRVHISSPPFAPAKCRQLVTDYVCLAKTRLEDLKETLELPGQEQKATGKSDGADELEAAVSSAVGLFETGGKVPTSVLEASIFRKPYYIGQFLPALLKPRPLPDRPDTKMGLIAALVKADKIPQTMYSNYVKTCKKEALQLLAGVFVDLESDNEMELSPLEQFEHSLKHLGSAVAACCSGQSSPKLTETISQMCERLEAVLATKSPQGHLTRPSECVDLSTGYIPVLHLQVVDQLLNFIAQTLMSVYTFDQPKFEWVSKLVVAISQYNSFVEALLRRVWTLLVKQAVSLDTHHIDSLAALLVELERMGDKVPAVTMNTNCSRCVSTSGSLTDLALRTIRAATRCQMHLVLRLTSSYLKFAICAYDGKADLVILPEVAKKFSYLATRLVPELRYCLAAATTHSSCSDNIVETLYLSERVQKLLETFQLSWNDWLMYEMDVCPEQDVLTDLERFEYHNWAVYQNFLPRPEQEGGCGGDHMAMAETALKALMTADCREVGLRMCPDCQGKTTDKIIPYSRCYIVNILQGITQQFIAREEQNGPPWLIKQLTECVQRASDSIQKQRIVQDFFHLCLSLPAYLLLSNTLGSSSAETSKISMVTDVINTVMVEHLCEGIHFAASLSAYFAQAVLQAANPTDWLTVLDRICEKCPALMMSFMVHSTAVSPFLNQSELGNNSMIGALLQFQRTRVTTGQLDAWHIATAVFSHIVQGNYSAGNGCLSEEYHLDKIRCKGDVYKKLGEMLTLQLTYCHHFTQHKDWRQIERLEIGWGKLLEESDTNVVGHLLSSSVDVRTRSCVRENCLTLKYLTVIRMLNKLCDSVHVGDKLDLSGVTGLLRGYTDVSRLLEAQTEEETAQSPSLTELTTMTQTVIKLLELVPASLLRQLDQIKCDVLSLQLQTMETQIRCYVRDVAADLGLHCVHCLSVPF